MECDFSVVHKKLIALHFLIHLHINSLIHLGMGGSPLGFNRNFSSPGSLPTILDASPHFELNQEPQFTDNMPTVPVRAPFGQSKPKAIPESKGTKRYHPSEGTVVRNHSSPSFPLPADVVSNVSFSNGITDCFVNYMVKLCVVCTL